MVIFHQRKVEVEAFSLISYCQQDLAKLHKNEKNVSQTF
jgi:hypothetical protein